VRINRLLDPAQLLLGPMREDEGNEDGHTDGRAKDEDDEQGDDDLL